jgi:hypothetical protein
MNVQPAKILSNKIPVKFGWFRARYADRKYKNKEINSKMGWKGKNGKIHNAMINM